MLTKDELVKLYQPVKLDQLNAFDIPLHLKQAAFHLESRPPLALQGAKYLTSQQLIHGKEGHRKGSKDIVLKKEFEEDSKKDHYFVLFNKNGKTIRKGPFVLFYEIEQDGKRVDWNDEIWYYKKEKDTYGPVSSYNMDKFYFNGEVAEQTKVAFRSLDKFIKLSKIITVVRSEQDKKAGQDSRQ